LRWLWACGLAVLLAPGLALAIGTGSIFSVDSSGQWNVSNVPPKTVVLTFDDGPSAYTEKILAILKQKHVHAVFFVVGQEALNRPILKQIYDDGNEIGNHTYSHPDLTTMSELRIRAELNVNRLIIESQTGHGTRLFRPPYLGSDSLTQQSEDLIRIVDGYGYLTLDEDIDTDDWRRPGVAHIVKAATVGQPGGIILMHDGGGDRSQTVAALPSIIDYYQKQGYRFETMSQVMRVSRDALMPAATGTDRVLAAATGLMFGAWTRAWDWLWWCMLALVVAGFVRMMVVVLVALVQARRRKPREPQRWPACSVIVPAHNEEKVIVSCLKSVLASDYPEFEVLVVDDGSTDRTAMLALSLNDRRVEVLAKPNGGKATALNYGIERSLTNYIVAIDADTVFTRNTLRNLLRHFQRPEVGAVSGNTRVANRHRLLTKLQALEYVVGFNLDRRMCDLLDCITVVPGAVGAFRKSVLYQVQGFWSDTLAEDTDLTLAIKEQGCTIVYDDAAVAYTETPATLRELLKQRFRWTFGTMQAVWKHRRSLLNPRQGSLGLVGLPYLLLFQIIFPLMGPLFDLGVIAGLVSGRTQLVLGSFVVYSVADVVVSAVALKMEPGERLTSLWLLVPQRLVYRQLMYYVIVRSLVNVLRGNLVGWGAMKREGQHLAGAGEAGAS